MKENQELDHLFWKDEILQVMYWLYGEGLEEQVSIHKLCGLLQSSEEVLQQHLDQLVIDMYLLYNGNDLTYQLTEIGKKEAGQHFSEAFEGMQKAGHGECSPDCDCQWEGHDSCQHHLHNH